MIQSPKSVLAISSGRVTTGRIDSMMPFFTMIAWSGSQSSPVKILVAVYMERLVTCAKIDVACQMYDVRCTVYD
jgi:hypothetical protein